MIMQLTRTLIEQGKIRESAADIDADSKHTEFLIADLADEPTAIDCERGSAHRGPCLTAKVDGGGRNFFNRNETPESLVVRHLLIDKFVDHFFFGRAALCRKGVDPMFAEIGPNCTRTNRVTGDAGHDCLECDGLGQTHDGMFGCGVTRSIRRRNVGVDRGGIYDATPIAVAHLRQYHLRR